MLLLEFAALLAMTTYWLSSLQQALESVRPGIRSLNPSQVWLVYIPLFGLIWAFIVNTRVSESLAREYRQRGWSTDEARPGFEIGAIVCVLACLFFVQYGYTFQLPIVSFLLAVFIGGAMYRHSDRINAFAERINNEPLVEHINPAMNAPLNSSFSIHPSQAVPTPPDDIQRWAPRRNQPPTL